MLQAAGGRAGVTLKSSSPDQDLVDVHGEESSFSLRGVWALDWSNCQNPTHCLGEFALLYSNPTNQANNPGNLGYFPGIFVFFFCRKNSEIIHENSIDIHYPTLEIIW